MRDKVRNNLSKLFFIIFSIWFLITIFPSLLLASDEQITHLSETQNFIKEFMKDSRSVIDTPLQKYDTQGNKINSVWDNDLKSYTYVRGDALKDRRNFKSKEKYVKKVKEYRSNRLKGLTKNDFEKISGGKRPAKDDPRTFLGKEFEGNLAKLPISAKLLKRPWSSDYWAIKYGVTSVRYNWKKYYDTIKKEDTWKSAISCYEQPEDYKNKKDIDDFEKFVADYYSPAEKYDLLVGDTNFTLTNSMKKEGEGYANSDGDVERWMGICHGWAPASYASPRPVKAVTLMAADGKTRVTFYPDDIRALVVQKWANTEYDSLFLGGRCNDKDENIEKDTTTGAVVDDRCFDINPANWHTIVTNMIGVRKQSFVIDSTFDYEVWNQPVYKYTVRFFNPKTKEIYKPVSNKENEINETINQARIKISDWQDDPFSKTANSALKRSKNAQYVIGVIMQLTYIAEVRPDHDGDPNYDEQVSVKYVYDLGLDENNNIISKDSNDNLVFKGEGEWYQNAHPDFIWTAPFAKESQGYSIPTNIIDEYIAKMNIIYSPSENSVNEQLDLLSQLIIPKIKIKAPQLSSSDRLGDKSPLKTVIEGLLNISAE